MKVGIITFQLAWNCGAVLQCFALQEYLKGLGHEVQIINYKPDYKLYKYKKYCNPFLMAQKEVTSEQSFMENSKRFSKRFARTLLNYKSGSEHIRQWKGFGEFCEKYLNLTEEYHNIEELKANPPICDVYISGSDQLWNPKLTNNDLDRAYFLDFGSNQIKKLTYAISACELDYEKYASQMQGLIDNIDYLSLREKEGKTELEQLSKREVSICPDPTFLPNRHVYEKIQVSNVQNVHDYILVYALEDSNKNGNSFFDKVLYASKTLGKGILVICGPRNWPYPVTQIRGVTPEEFLYYIKNASYIISNSFHATVFSILYHKRFSTLGFKNRNTRMAELLKTLGLSSHMVETAEEIVESLREEINYIEVESRIAEMQTRGTRYLFEAMK